MPPHARSVRRRVEADEILRLKAHSVPVCGDRSAPSQVPTQRDHGTMAGAGTVGATWPPLWARVRRATRGTVPMSGTAPTSGA